MRRLMISLMALVLCAGVLFNSVPANAAPVQWSVESGGNGHWYEAVYTGSPTSYISWDDAKAGAEAPGGYLACITSKEAPILSAYPRIKGNVNSWIMGS